MDPVTEIVTALGAGAASARQDGTEDAVKVAYSRLHELVKKLFSGHPSAAEALAQHQASPQAGKAALAGELDELGASNDAQVMNAARELLLLLDKTGTLGAKLHSFQGGQVGSGNIMLNFYPGNFPYAPSSSDEFRAAHPRSPLGEDLMSRRGIASAMIGRRPARYWSPGFSSALAYSLGEFSSMEDSGFRTLFLRRVREQLGMPEALRVGTYQDARDHILAIVFACQDHEDPAAAVKALHDVMSELRPGTAGLGLLQDCYWTASGMTALSIERLHSVLEIIRPLSWECDRITVHDIAREAALDHEVLPLRGTEDLIGVLRRLNVARVSASARVPLVVRFLARLARRVGATAGSRLQAEVGEIMQELDVTGDGLDDLAAPAQPDSSARVLQIRVEEASSPGNPRYAIDAAVFSVAPRARQRITSWQCDEDCSVDDMEEVGRRFLEQAEGLGRSIGEAGDLLVEFLLPWSLLGHPVERWTMDEDGFWIGHTFPVVVRSLDRQRKESFYQSWRHRWDLLLGQNANRPVGQQMGWLHHGDGTVPENASRAGRVVRLTSRNALTQWLEKEENYATAALGLTFSYKPDDPVALSGVKAAVHEGIPLLMWLRGQSDVSQLERMLEDVDIHDLPGRVLKWRRQTADFDVSTRDARYQVVLLWDDPGGVGRPSERRFAAPR